MDEDRVNVQASSDRTDWFELACKLVFVFIFCVFVSFIAGFTSSLFWHAHYEPLLYPCPDANKGGLCEYKHQTPPSRDEPMLIDFLFFDPDHLPDTTLSGVILAARYLPSLKMTAARDAGKQKGRGKSRKYRPHIISILTVGMGGTIVIGILYLFGLYGPDIYGSRAWLADFDPIESALIVWVVTAFCVMLEGPYGAYAKNGREDKEA